MNKANEILRIITGFVLIITLSINETSNFTYFMFGCSFGMLVFPSFLYLLGNKK